MTLNNKRAVFLGDSITEGVGTTSPEKIYHQLLKQKFNFQIACNCGVGGTRISQRKIPTYDICNCDLYFGLNCCMVPLACVDTDHT